MSEARSPSRLASNGMAKLHLPKPLPLYIDPSMIRIIIQKQYASYLLSVRLAQLFENS